jgi:hypothetical protein
MPRSIPVIAVLFLAAFCLLPAAYSQTTGGVKGRIRNMNGDAIAGATVTARKDQRDAGSARAGKNGDFTLDGLQPGLYNFVIEARGYAEGIKYDIEVKPGKIRDLGGNLLLQVDHSSQVMIRGSVFWKDGTSVQACDVEVALVGANGEVKTLTTLTTGISGEFSYRRPEGKATYRFTSKCHGVTASRDLSVDSAAVYTTSVLLPINRGEKQQP